MIRTIVDLKPDENKSLDLETKAKLDWLDSIEVQKSIAIIETV